MGDLKSQDIVDYLNMVDDIKEKQESCEHIYGYNDDCIEIKCGDDFDYVDTIEIVTNKNDLTCNIFTYCPKCGKKLIDERKY